MKTDELKQNLGCFTEVVYSVSLKYYMIFPYSTCYLVICRKPLAFDNILQH